LTLVVVVAAGHDPIKATGLLLAHLSAVCEKTRPDRPQVWTLATTKKAPDDAWDDMTRAAERHETTAEALYRREQLTADELSGDPLR
jgi:hypothetical protein